MEALDLERDLYSCGKQLDELVFLKKEYSFQQVSLENETKGLDADISLSDKVSSLFKHLLDVLLEEKKKEIEHLVTYGLKTVFTDQDLKFHINIEPKYNTIYTTFKTEQVGVTEGDVLDNFGGGVVNIESFLLRIVTLFQTGLSPYLILDESFPHLMGDEYIENTSILLKNLCNELGLTILAITQKDQLINNSDRAYKAFSKDNKLSLEELKKV